MSKMHDAICKLNRLPESVFFAAGDFSHSNLRTVLAKFHLKKTKQKTKNVDIKTRKSTTLDQVSTDIPGSCKTHPHPPLLHGQRWNMKERKKDRLKHTPTKKPWSHNNVRMQLKARAAAPGLGTRRPTRKKELLCAAASRQRKWNTNSSLRIISERTTHAPCGEASKLSRLQTKPQHPYPPTPIR